MRSDLIKKISILLIFSLVLTGIIAGEAVQNDTSVLNSSDNSSNQSNSVLIPLENISNAAGMITDASNNSNFTVINNSDNSSGNNFINSSIQEDSNNYIPLNSQITTPDANPCASSEDLMSVTLVQNNKVEVKAQLPKSCNINNIQKQDITKNSTSKEVIVSSSVHVDSPLTVYTDISPIDPQQTDSVKIFWVNENTTITPTGFYDTNSDGKYDRISWDVPHLSTQYFLINVNITTTTSVGLVVNVASPANGATITNQTVFSISVNYPGNISALGCNLAIDGQNHNFNAANNVSLTYNLPNGNYPWNASCNDTTLNNYAAGSFMVNQIYSGITIPQPIYLLDQNNNLVGNPNTIVNLNTNGSNPDVFLYRGSSQIMSISNYPNSTLNVSSSISQFGFGDYNVTILFPDGSRPSQKFSVVQAYIVNTSIIQAGVPASISINTNLPPSDSSANIYVNFGDGHVQLANVPTDSVTNTYNSAGNYVILASVYPTNPLHNFNISYPVSVTSAGTSSLAINLINPANNQLMNDTSTPVFAYSVSGNPTNCTFYLWNGTTGSPTTPYTQQISNPSGLSINYVNAPYALAGGTYGWDVTCANSTAVVDAVPSGGYYFTIGSGLTNYSYSQQEMMQDARDALDNFTSLESSYSLDQMEAMNDLGITDNLTYFSKRLAQIDQDLGINVNYITDSNKKSQTILSETNEIYNIRSSIPDSIDVSSSTEFVKNSLTAGMDNIVKTYADNNHMSLNSYELNQLSQMNYNIQKYISVDTKIKQVSLSYLGQSSSITLVSKQVNISNSSLTNIIEVIPSDINSPVVFLTKATPIGNSMYLISSDDPSFIQNGGKIVYYFTTPIDNPEDMKKSDTVLFEDFSVSRSGITGFIVNNLTGSISFWYYPMLIAALIVFVYAGKRTASKVQLAKWRKEENVNRIMENIEKAKKALREEDNIEIAKESYHRIKELFALVPSGFKRYAIEEIEKIRRGIDRRDIIGFVKEYEKARVQGRQEDAKSLYSEIKRTYKRLPKKDQEKVYHKMFKEKWDI